jgi:hypothetical protein
MEAAWQGMVPAWQGMVPAWRGPIMYIDNLHDPATLASSPMHAPRSPAFIPEQAWLLDPLFCCCCCCRCRELLEFVGTESLAAQWHRDRASTTQSNVTRAIAQATSYAAAAGIR